MIKKCILFLLVCIPFFALADETYLQTMSMLDFIMMLIFGMCRIAGIVFIFMSFVYYRRFRQNPHETPLNRVIWVLVLGLLIFFIPTLAEYNNIYSTMQTAGEEAPLT